MRYLLPVILVFALSEGLSAQADSQTLRVEPPEDGIIVRWSRRDPITIYSGHISWTVEIQTAMYNSFRVTGTPGPNTIIVRDEAGNLVPPSPVQPVYTLESGNVHSDFFNGSFRAFTLAELGFYLAPGGYSIEVIHRNDQEPPKGSTHSSPPFKGELATPRFEFEALPHPDPGWGKAVFDLELTVSSGSTKVAVGGPITLQATIRNIGSEPRTLPDAHWNYLARAYLDDPYGGRFREQKRVDVAGMAWIPKSNSLAPGKTLSFSYSTEGFAFRNKHIGSKRERMSVYLVVPGPKTDSGEATSLYSNKVPIGIYRPLQVRVWCFGLAAVLLTAGAWIVFRVRGKKRKSQPRAGADGEDAAAQP